MVKGAMKRPFFIFVFLFWGATILWLVKRQTGGVADPPLPVSTARLASVGLKVFSGWRFIPATVGMGRTEFPQLLKRVFQVFAGLLDPHEDFGNIAAASGVNLFKEVEFLMIEPVMKQDRIVEIQAQETVILDSKRPLKDLEVLRASGKDLPLLAQLFIERDVRMVNETQSVENSLEKTGKLEAVLPPADRPGI